MSAIEVTKDVENSLLERREVTCNFNGLGGKLKKLEAVDMVSKQLKLNSDKKVIPIKLTNESGKSVTSGVFYIYDDEALAKKHLSPVVFKRLEKAKKKEEEQKQKEQEQQQQEAEEQQNKEEAESAAEEDKTKESANTGKEGSENKEDTSETQEGSGDN